MRTIRSWCVRLSNFFRREHWERDLTDEMQCNLEFQIADNVRAGMTPEEARRAARLKFGSIDVAKEGVRDRRGIPILEHFMHDLFYAIRTLAKRPILLATTTISIGLGVGINIAVYSTLRAVLFQTSVTAAAPG